MNSGGLVLRGNWLEQPPETLTAMLFPSLAIELARSVP